MMMARPYLIVVAITFISGFATMLMMASLAPPREAASAGGPRCRFCTQSQSQSQSEHKRKIVFLWHYGLFGTNDFKLPSANKDGVELTSALVLAHPALQSSSPCLLKWLEVPHSRHVILDARSAELFVRHYFPQYLQLYNNFPKPVMRSDLLRYLLLYQFGGIHSDVDCCPTGNGGALGDLISHFSPITAFFFTETILTPAESISNGHAFPIRHSRPELRQRISNYFIISLQPRHPFFLSLLADIAIRFNTTRRHLSPSFYDVLYITGPDVVTEAVYAFCGWSKSDDDIVGEQLHPGGIVSIRRAAREGSNSSSDDCRDHGMLVVQRPNDQLLFSHNARGRWR